MKKWLTKGRVVLIALVGGLAAAGVLSPGLADRLQAVLSVL